MHRHRSSVLAICILVGIETTAGSSSAEEVSRVAAILQFMRTTIQFGEIGDLRKIARALDTEFQLKNGTVTAGACQVSGRRNRKENFEPVSKRSVQITEDGHREKSNFLSTDSVEYEILFTEDCKMEADKIYPYAEMLSLKNFGGAACVNITTFEKIESEHIYLSPPQIGLIGEYHQNYYWRDRFDEEDGLVFNIEFSFDRPTGEQCASSISVRRDVAAGAHAVRNSGEIPLSYFSRYEKNTTMVRPESNIHVGEKKFDEIIRDCRECPRLTIIPAGSFVMGSAEIEEHSNQVNSQWSARANRFEGLVGEESPRHEVQIKYDFAMGTYPVTASEYSDFETATGAPDRLVKGAAGLTPVVGVSWANAEKYTRWLSRKTGKRYRLPSEAEWEYAARAGSPTAYYWGDAIDTNAPRCAACAGRKATITRPVGFYPPNTFGLYDMLGSVWQWVEDCEHQNYVGAPRDGSAWTNASACDEMVVRGGSTASPFGDVRTAARRFQPLEMTPPSGWTATGFRVVREMNEDS